MTNNFDHDVDLLFTGFSFGLLHVLAGPDHLSALAALSVGSSWRAFNLGFRWGIGHSSGLVGVAAIFIYLKGEMNLILLEKYCDTFVGIFMIALGCYGVLGALKIYREKKMKREEVHFSSSFENIGAEEYSSIMDIKWLPFIDMHEPITQRLVSFLIGLLHGVAGPGGILGVLPAVEMKNLRSSCIYLGSFIIASTLSMGTFASLYGEITKRLGSTTETMELGLSVFSSFLSLMVGVVWLGSSLTDEE